MDSLAAVVLQNRRGLDLLTAEKGGICLFLQEECCFFANRSGIVRDKIKKLQEDLEKRRHALMTSPFWTSFNGLLPFLLPLLGPILTLLLLLTFGPCIINKIAQFVQKRVEAIQLMNVHVQYQRLATRDDESYEGPHQ